MAAGGVYLRAQVTPRLANVGDKGKLELALRMISTNIWEITPEARSRDAAIEFTASGGSDRHLWQPIIMESGRGVDGIPTIGVEAEVQRTAVRCNASPVAIEAACDSRLDSVRKGPAGPRTTVYCRV